MSHIAAPPRAPGGPIALVGRATLNSLAYLSGLASIPASAAGSVFSRDIEGRLAEDNVATQLGWMFSLAIPLVALVHVGIGSFLAMQSYFGGTFADGTGAVVGVGLLRNLAPLLSGIILAFVLAARMTPELRLRAGRAEGRVLDAGKLRLPAPALGCRLIAATIAGPVLGLWAAGIGTLVGWQVAQTMMGVSTHSFFHMFWEMLWIRDLMGVLFKGLANGLLAAIFVCQEGLSGRADDDIASLSWAACRAACFGSIAILIVNSGWFILFYHAGPAFGPTLLEPPGL